MYGLLNIASLFLGFAAWTLPVLVMIRKKPVPGCGEISFSLCSLSLLYQILYNHHLVTIRDWSAVEDTHGAVVLAAVVLTIVTGLLNVLRGISLRRE